MPAQFPGLRGAVPAGPPEPLVSIKAGMMNAAPISGTRKFTVSADLRKGVITLGKQEDGMNHFQWKDRLTSSVDVDAIVFPGDAVFSKVDTKKEGDRVYLLQFSGSSRRFFFWMQDKADDKDEEQCKKLNDAIANPEAAASQAAAAPAGGAPGAGGAANDQAAQLMQMLGGGAGGAGVQSQDLQAILQSMGMNPPAAASSAAATPAAASSQSPVTPATTAGAAGTAAAAAPGAGAGGSLTAADVQRAMMGLGVARAPPTSLNLVVNSEAVLPEVTEEADQASLLPHLVEGQQTPEDLRQVFGSPQLQQALSSLGGALQTENFNSIMANFNLDPAAGGDALAQGDAVRAFLAAIQAQADADAEESKEGGDGDADL